MLKIASAFAVYTAATLAVFVFASMGLSMATKALSDPLYPRCELFSGACDPQYITQGSVYLALMLGCIALSVAAVPRVLRRR